jgi:hypothetical protein
MRAQFFLKLQETSMSNVHFIGGEKGGVGKSMTSRLLAQYLIDSGKPFIGLDSDQSHSTFSRFYGEFSSPLIVSDFDSLDQLVLLAQDNPNADLLVDLAAQTSKQLGQWIEESDALGLFEELGCNVFLWHVMDDGIDSVNLLDQLLTRYQQPFIKIVVVCNMGRGECFSYFEKSNTYLKAQERGAFFLTLAKLQAQLAARIDFSNTNFWAATNSPGAANIVERARVRHWLKNNYNQFDKLLTVQ